MVEGDKDKLGYQSIKYLVVALILWALIYYQTLLSMVEIWWRSETFTHGFLIFPIAFYLIWQKKSLFITTDKKPSAFFATLLLGTVFFWFFANIVDVRVIQQLMVVLMLPLIVGTLYGYKLVKQYLFPFMYLLFAVPIGEFLIPKLQYITAEITVLGLELSGIPVFYEGLFISIPEGDFEVAVACSGIRYLIASLALGTLYAYMMYTSYLKRGVFILASLVVPIVANGIRAYGIVLIAHLSDMKYATGVDHLIYGWLFFGFVIFILFYIGSFWEDKPAKEIPDEALLAGLDTPVRRYQSYVIGVVLLMLSGPLYVVWMGQHVVSDQQPTLSHLQNTSPWLISKPQQRWSPIFINSDAQLRLDYKNKDDASSVYYYKNEYLFEAQGKELINTMNVFYDINHWILIKHEIISVGSNNVIEYTVRSEQGKLMIWGWYDVMGLQLTHPILIKIIQAWAKMTFQDAGGQFTAIASPYFDNEQQARKVLEAFYQQNIMTR